MGPKKRKNATPTDSPYASGQTGLTCVFCHQGPSDKPLIGKLFCKDNIVAHRFCLYFAANLVQKDDFASDDEGEDDLFHFKPDSIQQEVRRCARLKCIFCKLPNAPTGCERRRCSKAYHFSCGIENDVLFHFVSYKSFCIEHQPGQSQPNEITEPLCHICKDDLLQVVGQKQIYCPNCKRWLHRDCVQSYAESAGLHHIKCPMCNAADIFKKEIRRLGIYIPDRDAAWETDGRYGFDEGADLTCCAERCLCPKGLNYDGTDELTLIPCPTCGEHGIHKGCIEKGIPAESWECHVCCRATSVLNAQEDAASIFDSMVRGGRDSMITQHTNGRSSGASSTASSLAVANNGLGSAALTYQGIAEPSASSRSGRDSVASSHQELLKSDISEDENESRHFTVSSRQGSVISGRICDSGCPNTVIPSDSSPAVLSEDGSESVVIEISSSESDRPVSVSCAMAAVRLDENVSPEPKKMKILSSNNERPVSSSSSSGVDSPVVPQHTPYFPIFAIPSNSSQANKPKQSSPGRNFKWRPTQRKRSEKTPSSIIID